MSRKKWVPNAQSRHSIGGRECYLLTELPCPGRLLGLRTGLSMSLRTRPIWPELRTNTLIVP